MSSVKDTSIGGGGVSSNLAPRPSPGVDTQDNRSFIQRSKLWILGELIATNLINNKPSDPIVATIALLEEKNEAVEAEGGASNLVTNPGLFQVDEPPTPEAVNDARLYMHEWRLAFLFEDWIKSVVEHKPSVENLLHFTIDFYKKVRDGQHAKWKRLRDQIASNNSHMNEQNQNQFGQSNGNSNNNEQTVVIAFDSNAFPSPTWTSFAARAASVGVVEMGFLASVKPIGDVTVEDLAEARAVLLVVGEEEEGEQEQQEQNAVEEQQQQQGENNTDDTNTNDNNNETTEKKNNAVVDPSVQLDETNTNNNGDQQQQRSASNANNNRKVTIDETILSKFSEVGKSVNGALIICGQDATDERIEKLTDIFSKCCLVEKCAQVSQGSTVALGRGRALLMFQRDEGSASACNLVGRRLVDESPSNSSRY